MQLNGFVGIESEKGASPFEFFLKSPKSLSERRMSLKINSCDRKVEIEYPCRWIYKVIGLDYDLARHAVLEVIHDRDCEISYSKSSSAGKYHSMNVEVHVESEEERNRFYIELKQHPAVKMVL